jgi:hypothetical protein
MFPTPYVELNAVLRALVEGMQAALGDDFVSACLQGPSPSAISMATVTSTLSLPPLAN